MLSVWQSSEARRADWLVQACSSAPWPFLSFPTPWLLPPNSRLAGSRPGLLCILGSLGGVLPARSRGMQATRRPNEVVSLRRIVIPQFRFVPPFSGLRQHSGCVICFSEAAALLLNWRSSTWLHQRCGFFWSWGCIIPSAERGRFFLFSCTDSRVWHVLSPCIQKMPGDAWGSLIALLTWGNLNEFLPALHSHRDTENSVQFPVLK